MALRMARYQFEFYQEMQALSKSSKLNPSFSILLYNGNPKWTAPEKFSELLIESSIPKEYLPEFKYFKIAINEIPKRELVKIRNAVAAVFYIENSDLLESGKNLKELVSLLKGVLKKDGGDIVRAIINRIYEVKGIKDECKELNTVEDLTEVGSMLETNVKIWEEKILEKGIEKGIEKRDLEIVTKMIENGINSADIRKMTGLSLAKVEQIKRKVRK